MSKKKPRASKTVPSFIRDSGRHVCNDLISRVFRRVRVFLLCAFERQKNALSFSQKKSSSKKKTKNFSLLFFPPFFSKRSPLQKISAYFNRDEEGGDEEQTRKNNNNNNEDVGSREGVLPLYELANLFVARVRNVHVVRCMR